MRSATVAAGLIGPVLLAALYAPFVHAHPDDHDTDHHDGPAVHAHFAAHRTPAHALDDHDHDGTAVEADDHDRAVFLQGFVAAPTASVHILPAIVDAVELATPEERASDQPLLVAHGHDPPSVLLLPSRAPPLSHLS